MKTWVTDNFPLKRLECQYFDICKEYDPSDCMYTDECNLRQELRKYLEPYITKINMKFQIDLIVEEDGKKEKT